MTESEDTNNVFTSGEHDEPPLLDVVLNHPLTQFLAFGGFVAMVVGIVISGFDGGANPPLDSSDLGTKADRTIRASHQFSYREPQAAEPGTKSSPYIYDWKSQKVEAQLETLRDGFEKMRRAMAENAANYLNRQSSSSGVKLDDFESSRVESLLHRIPPSIRIQWAESLKARYFEQTIGTSVPRHLVAELAKHGFSQTLEDGLVQVLEDVLYEAVILPDDQRLQGPSEGPVRVRRLDGQQVVMEYLVSSPGSVLKTVSQMRPTIRRTLEEGTVAGDLPLSKETTVGLVQSVLRPNTTYNNEATARYESERGDIEGAAQRKVTFQKGDLIVAKGDRVTRRDLEAVRSMYSAKGYLSQAQLIAGASVLVLLIILSLYVFGQQNLRAFDPTGKDLLFMGLAMLTFLVVTWVWIEMSLKLGPHVAGIDHVDLYYVAPVAAAGMLVRLVLKNLHAVLFTIAFGLLVAFLADYSVAMLTYTLIGTLAGITAVQQVKHRMALVWSGVVVGAVNVGVLTGFLLVNGQLLSLDSLKLLGLGMVSGVGSGSAVLALLPVFEFLFDYTTDIKLLELANLDHPLLRQLIMRASGTYHHSMMVGSLSEAAAEAIGANALLCRVGAYFHDIGKAQNPQYFVENQRLGDNPHDKLKPSMSALIIKAHVKDGLEMARQHNLPRIIRDFIAQHHGTSLIAYFYDKAKKQEDPDIPEVDEADFRYPGPKPQHRETAICMLADASEAASRALPNPTPSRLSRLVRNIINKVFTNGQLDECDLTLKDLNSIAEAFTRILTGIYHHRPSYPSETKESKSTPGAADEEERVEVDQAEEKQVSPQDQATQQTLLPERSSPPREAETYLPERE